MNCASCGKEIPDDSEFCAFCGASTGAAAAAPQGPPQAPPAPPAYAPPPPPPPGAAAPPTGAISTVPYGPPAAKKSALPWILAVLGVLAGGAIVVVLLLGFAVGPKWFAGDDGGNGLVGENPEATVEAFFESLEKQDARMLLGTMEPDFVEEIEDALGSDYLALMEEYFFTAFPEDLEFDIEKMESEIDGDGAEVTIKKGTMSYTDKYGDEVTGDASELDMDAFELVKVDGKWYLAEDTLIDMGFDFSDIGGYDDMDHEDGTSDTDMDIEELVDLPVDTEDEVLTVILEEEDVWDWYMETDYPQYDISEESDRWVIRLYELDEDGNEIDFAYYEVDKETAWVGMITNE